jgi:uncharacterized secreted protein with C-terminal beta-propeller domain
MEKEINSKYALIFVIALFFVVVGIIGVKCDLINLSSFPKIKFPHISLSEIFNFDKVKDVEKFASEEDFKNYLQNAQLSYSGGFVPTGMGENFQFAEKAVSPPTADGRGAGGEEERVSTTNVQVLGIDEPDIVKTDGKEIYFSPAINYYLRLLIEEIVPPGYNGEIKLIKGFPPADLKVDFEIDQSGDLLLKNNILVIFSGDKIYGYDVSDKKSPEKKWTIDLENNNYLVAARLYNNKIYLVTRTQIDSYRPCPIKPLSADGTALEIKCTDIYHPVPQVPIDVTYHTMTLNPDSGKIENTTSFVGNSSSSIVYMSENAIYITYSYFENTVKFYTDFFKEKCKDIIPGWVIDKLGKLQEYDISDSSKLTEFEIVLQRYYSSLDDDERLKVENEINNRLEDYFKDHKRELETTGIVKIGVSDFKIAADGNVPGQPLNQFSLDEYEGYLRVATTVGQNMFWWGFNVPQDSANDVYVLDKNLEITGSVKDLGLEEKIYSARFIEDKGYLVTFKQTDPFYVLDLSNPKKPELKGELKIPGYSSYLHPITKDKILGIGKEGSQVKISLFNVADPKNPTEIDKYTLDEYWSDILNTHHAFLLDEKHSIFFLPGQKGGYIFSYKNDRLELEKAVSDVTAKRAIYINDYLYIVGDDKIVVLNESDWTKTNELEF